MSSKDVSENVDFRSRNLNEWESFLQRLFNGDIPRTKVWRTKEEIITVLNELGSVDSLSHLFFPGSGGFDLTGAKASFENDCIELDCDGLAGIVKPGCLSFESFGADHEWAYFRLENLQLEPTGIYDNILYGHEELLELTPLEYAERGIWDQGFWYYDENSKEIPLPKEARIVVRILRGSMVIFAKSSLYNGIPFTYDGRHNKMTASEFRSYIQAKVDCLNNLN